MGVNNSTPANWPADTALSVDMYNQWFFTFAPQGNQTLVTWTMTGQKNFLFKAFGLFLVLGLIMGVSALALGIGLIWTIPLFVIAIGVLYRIIFGVLPPAN